MRRVFNWEPSDKLFEHPDWTSEEVQEYTAEWGTSHKPGCRPRISQAGEWCPMASERIKIIPENEWSDILADPNRVDLRTAVFDILDQDGVGSCATEATAGAIMATGSFAGRPTEILNPWAMYRVVSGGIDRGSNIDTCLAYARENGIPPERLHPRNLGWRAKPSDEAVAAALENRIVEFYDIQNKTEFGSALLQGFAVVYGRRGHALCGLWLASLREFVFGNSWDESWGNNGMGQESLSGINWGYGAFAVRTLTDREAPVRQRVSEIPPLPPGLRG